MANSQRLDWKKISRSKGYTSLKAAYVRDVQELQKRNRRGHHPTRGKEEYRGYFKKAIGLAMRYSNKFDMEIEEVLNIWENYRDCWWLSFYQESNNLDRMLKKNL